MLGTIVFLIVFWLGLCVMSELIERRASRLGLCLDCDKPIRSITTIPNPKKYCECGGFCVYPRERIKT